MINIFAVTVLATSLCFFLYTFLRPKFKARVNCWFCNNNQWVLYLQRNSFICKKCDQYNGFDESGDYNKFIPSQRIETLNIDNPTAKKIPFLTYPSKNGLCELCNQMQAVIIERLNKFEAVDERQYFEEYERYKSCLNQKYPLCGRCQEYTNQKLQSVDERYLPKPKATTKSFHSNPFAITRNLAPNICAPSLVSESSSYAKSVFSEPRRAPSICSFSSSRDPSPFIHRRPPPSIFSESPTFIRSSRAAAPSVASGFSYKTSVSRIPSVQQSSAFKSKNVGQNQRRKFYFSSGRDTVACNILTFIISFLLFISFFDSSQISSNVRFLALEEYLPIDAVNALHLCTNYGAIIAAFASALFYYGFNKSKTRINFFELLASISWPIFSMFCIFDAKRNPDFNLIKMIFSSFLFILSSMILFIPKKFKHQKRPNNIYSVFSYASTAPSQCSSSYLTAASPNQSVSNLSSLSHTFPEQLPDPVESWVCSTAEEQQNVTRLHDLHI